jgi:hypothetical protein
MYLRLLFIPFIVILSAFVPKQCYSDNSLLVPDNDIFIIYRINPNPATYKTEITYKIPEGEYAELVLYNISGLQIFSIELEESSGSITITLDSYEKGIYFIGIKHNGKLLKAHKLIKA